MLKGLLKVEQLTKKYGKNRAIQNISFSLRAHEIYGLVGPNGAGKTTIIRLIMGFILPDKGTITIGHPEIPPAHALTQVGYCSGESIFYEELSTRQHFHYLHSLQTKVKKNAAALTRAAELAGRMSLPLEKPIKKLSKGNKQKISIIQALMFEPPLLIMDEPTTALDPLIQHIFFTLLREINQRGTTILISSHQLYDIEKICDRVGMIKDGILHFEKSIEEIKQNQYSEIYFELAPPLLAALQQKLPGQSFIEIDKHVYKTMTHEVNPVLQTILGFEPGELEVKKVSLEQFFLNQFLSNKEARSP
jgi:ABC-2 type transport system ATP-binding protein